MIESHVSEIELFYQSQSTKTTNNGPAYIVKLLVPFLLKCLIDI